MAKGEILACIQKLELVVERKLLPAHLLVMVVPTCHIKSLEIAHEDLEAIKNQFLHF